MEAVDLSSRSERLGLFFLTVIHPALWLAGLAGTLTVGVPADSVAWAASPAFLISAVGASAVIWRARAGRAPSRLGRCAIYTTWGWLAPYLLITAMAVSDFPWLWPALAILLLPAGAFAFSRRGRQWFAACAAGCIALAWLALLASSHAPVGFDTRLLIPLIWTVGPFWSLAAYLLLQEHALYAGSSAPGGRHEAKVAVAMSGLGVLLFFGLSFALIMIAVSSMR